MSVFVAFAVVSLSCVFAQTDKGCQPGWSYFGATKSCWKQFSDTAYFVTAQAICQRHGAELPSIHSASENAFMNALGEMNYKWTGINDNAKEGTFVYTDGTANDYTNWQSKPGANKNSNCAVMSNQGKWINTPCTTMRVVVCKMSAGATKPSCPEGYNFYSKATKRCYRKSTANSNFNKAEAICQATGGDLVSLHSKTESDLVYNLARTNTWTSMTSLAVKDVWKWRDGSATDWKPWATNQPPKKTTNRCAYLSASGVRTLACTSNQAYVCYANEGAKAPKCPEGYAHYLKKTGKCYAVSKQTDPWERARSRCLAEGGDLASAHSETENRLVGYIRRGNSWIGLSDAAKEGTWTWSDGSAVDLKKWANANYPRKSTTQNYAVIGGYNKWTDANGASALFSVCAVTAGAKRRCPVGYEFYNAKSKRCYGTDSVARLWRGARAHCRASGGDLAAISSKEEQAYVKTLYPVGWIWIGFSDVAKEGSWVWSNGEFSSYTNWMASRPNGKTNENYAAMHPNGQWEDFAKTSAFRSLCEAAPGAAPRCPEGWDFYSEASGSGRCYQWNKTPQTWEKANAICQSKGAQLLDITNDAENTEISRLTQKLGGFSWISLNDRQREGTFVWASGSTSTYRKWLKNQPDGKTNENCVTYQWNGVWHDLNCKTKKPFTCVAAASASLTRRCPKGVEYYNAENQRCYATGTKTMWYVPAWSYCRDLGLDLLSIHSKADEDFLFDVRRGQSWIGLNDRETEGSWKWTDGSVTGSAFTWQNGRPVTSSAAASYDCAAIYVSATKLYDFPCAQGRYPVCSSPFNSPTKAPTAKPTTTASPTAQPTGAPTTTTAKAAPVKVASKAPVKVASKAPVKVASKAPKAASKAPKASVTSKATSGATSTSSEKPCGVLALLVRVVIAPHHPDTWKCFHSWHKANWPWLHTPPAKVAQVAGAGATSGATAALTPPGHEDNPLEDLDELF